MRLQHFLKAYCKQSSAEYTIDKYGQVAMEIIQAAEANLFAAVDPGGLLSRRASHRTPLSAGTDALPPRSAGLSGNTSNFASARSVGTTIAEQDSEFSTTLSHEIFNGLLREAIDQLITDKQATNAIEIPLYPCIPPSVSDSAKNNTKESVSNAELSKLPWSHGPINPIRSLQAFPTISQVKEGTSHDFGFHSSDPQHVPEIPLNNIPTPSRHYTKSADSKCSAPQATHETSQSIARLTASPLALYTVNNFHLGSNTEASIESPEETPRPIANLDGSHGRHVKGQEIKRHKSSRLKTTTFQPLTPWSSSLK